MLRRVLWLLAGLAAVLAAAAWFINSTDPINPTTFERIKLGMTLAEVESLIGMPPGDYYTGNADWRLDKIALSTFDEGRPKLHAWIGNSYRMSITLDGEGRVDELLFTKVDAPNPSIPDRLRAWLAGW